MAECSTNKRCRVSRCIVVYMDLCNSNFRLIQIFFMDFEIRFKWTTLYYMHIQAIPTYGVYQLYDTTLPTAIHCSSFVIDVHVVTHWNPPPPNEFDLHNIHTYTCICIAIPYFLVIRRISLISAYSLLSACYFVGLSTRY